MGQGQEVKTREEPVVEIQERGEIFFFYRPRVGRGEAHDVDDVQRLYIVLRPESGEKQAEVKQESESGKEGVKKESKDGGDSGGAGSGNEGGHGAKELNIEKETLLRFIVMGRKKLPDTNKRSQPYWGFVELVTTSVDDVKTALEGEEYETSTRGHRRKSAARAVGEGVYRILRQKPKPTRQHHTHLVYKLELPRPDKDHEPQESLNVEPEGSFLIQIRNPDQHGSSTGFRGLQNKRKAQFPAHLQANLGHLRFCPADPPDFLNYEGCEFLLVAASDHIEKELGLELEGERVEEEAESECSDLVKTFGEGISTKPLFQGAWE